MENMSTDDESFIVLDETPSMLQFSLLESSFENDTEETFRLNSNYSSSTNEIVDLSQMSLNANGNSKDCISNDLNKIQSQSPLPKPAHSFLLGAIDCNTMKNSVQNYISSPGNSVQQQEFDKLRSLIQEHHDLKDNLQRKNIEMQQQYSMMQNWNVETLKETYQSEMKRFHSINNELFQQNNDLQMKVAELAYLAELNQNNCFKERERLKDESSKKFEYEKEIQCLKMQLAQQVTMNVEMEENFTEKCTQLQAKIDEYKNTAEEIESLKAQKDLLTQNLNQCKALVTEYRNELNAMQTQCDMFREDFKKERKAREEVVFERDQMIADINMLKTRNQALIAEAQSYYNETSVASLTSLTNNSSLEQSSESTFICPLCSKIYHKYNDLESHVQSCLERNSN